MGSLDFRKGKERLGREGGREDALCVCVVNNSLILLNNEFVDVLGIRNKAFQCVFD